MPVTKLTTQCCICGGGPAGMMLGFLLARAGVEVIVLEKHADFFRDFRGDTLHPSTMQIMHELGLLDAFMLLPHQEVHKLIAQFNGIEVQVADFSHLPVPVPALSLLPQWDFLHFLLQQAAEYPSFSLVREAGVYALIKKSGRVTGVKANISSGELEIESSLVIGADGRSSDIRKLAGLAIVNTGAPIDVLWFRLSKTETDPQQTLGKFDHGRIMILIDRDTYWQCAYVIIKGDFENIKAKGLGFFRKELSDISPFLSTRVQELKEWNDIKLLSVVIDHLQTWYAEGVLCIGDAAHAMSPIGGVGINLAIQDAVATANILFSYFLENKPITPSVLAKVQRRREFPARIVQRVQVAIQNGMIKRRQNMTDQKLPILLSLLKNFPLLSRLPARFVGIGIRPEHVRTPDIKSEHL